MFASLEVGHKIADDFIAEVQKPVFDVRIIASRWDEII